MKSKKMSHYGVIFVGYLEESHNRISSVHWTDKTGAMLTECHD